MKKLIAAALMIAILLTSCGSANNDVPIETSNKNSSATGFQTFDGASAQMFTINGVECVMAWRGGVDCNWKTTETSLP